MNSYLTCRLDKTDKKVVRRAARGRKMTVSAWIREVLVREGLKILILAEQEKQTLARKRLEEQKSALGLDSPALAATDSSPVAA